MKIYSKNERGELLETETKDETHSYTLEFLNSQKIMLGNELVKVNSLLAEALKVGVKLKVKEII